MPYVDFDAEDDTDNFLIPPGEYVAKVTSIEEKDSSNGNPVWVMDWEILKVMEGDQKWRGYSHRHWHTFVAFRKKQLKEMLEALGVTCDKARQLDRREVIEKECVIRLEKDHYLRKNAGVRKECRQITAFMPLSSGPIPF